MDSSTTQHDTQTPPQPLREKLSTLIEELPAEGLTLDYLLEVVGTQGMMLLITLLSLVFLIPVSIPGVSTIFGAAILLISLCTLTGRPLWLPQRLREKRIATDKLKPMLQRALRWIGYVEYISKPMRAPWMVSAKLPHILNSAGLVLGAILLMAPFGFIPFSNTFPAIAILCFSIGTLQRDGLAMIFGHVANLLTIIYFGILIAGGGIVIMKAFEYFTQ